MHSSAHTSNGPASCQLPSCLQYTKMPAMLHCPVLMTSSVEKLSQALLPFSNGCSPLFDKIFLTQHVQEYVNSKVTEFPWVSDRTLNSVDQTLKNMCLQAAVWDKERSKLHAVCAVQADQALVNLTILCPSFRLVGVDVCKGGAQKFVFLRTFTLP